MKAMRHLLPVALMLLMASCKDDDFVAPAFIHIEDIQLEVPAENALSTDSGFYTSDIVAAYVAIHYPGEMKLDTIGLFQLPFTVPVLHNGPIDYAMVYPAIAQSGIAATLPYYPALAPIRIDSTTMHGPVTLRAADTLFLGPNADGHLTSTYQISASHLLLFEPFEPIDAGTKMDTNVIWVRNDPEGARSGYGYGKVHCTAGEEYRKFGIEQDFIVTEATNILYLELDVRSDFDMQVNMRSAYVSGSNPTDEQVMVVYATPEWKHLYINLGRTWSAFNRNASFSLNFTALNLDGIEGDLLIDNIKVISAPATL